MDEDLSGQLVDRCQVIYAFADGNKQLRCEAVQLDIDRSTRTRRYVSTLRAVTSMSVSKLIAQSCQQVVYTGDAPGQRGG